jgi:hypothetical protein
MTIEVKNVRQNKNLEMKAKMEFNLIALVQLWDKCEDAKAYLIRLNSKVDDTNYSAKWSKLTAKSVDSIVSLSGELTETLHKLGAFDALKRSSNKSIGHAFE